MPFLSAGRPVNLVFDADIIAKKGVQLALKNLGYLCQKAGCIVGVVTWSLAEDTKGCDDLSVNRGLEAFDLAMNEALPYGEWLKSLEKQFSQSNSPVELGSQDRLRRLSTKQLLLYVRKTFADRLRYNELAQVIELDGEEFFLDSAYLYLAEYESLSVAKGLAADVMAQIAKVDQ